MSGRRTAAGMALGAAVAVTGGLLSVPAPAAAFAGPDACAACHAAEHEAWKPSVHARAFSGTFAETWKKQGGGDACLACHTTGHRPGTRAYAHAGVACEACHGPLGEGHPAEARMPIPVSSDMCRTCHRLTYAEWKVSKHGRKGIRCFDCHKAHGQGLRSGGGDSLCGSCHPRRLRDFAHASHHQAGLSCSSCHMPAMKAPADRIAGTGTAAHALSVGAATCARCHEDTVHRSAALPTLREEVSALKRQMAAAGVTDVFELKEHARDVEWRLARTKQGLFLAALLAFVAGLALGWLGRWYLGKRRP